MLSSTPRRDRSLRRRSPGRRGGPVALRAEPGPHTRCSCRSHRRPWSGSPRSTRWPAPSSAPLSAVLGLRATALCFVRQASMVTTGDGVAGMFEPIAPAHGHPRGAVGCPSRRCRGGLQGVSRV